jgi:hypothetical protein
MKGQEFVTTAFFVEILFFLFNTRLQLPITHFSEPMVDHYSPFCGIHFFLLNSVSAFFSKNGKELRFGTISCHRSRGEATERGRFHENKWL